MLKHELQRVEEYEVRLRTVPGFGTSGTQRLKLFLKVALRRFGLRALEVKPVVSFQGEFAALRAAADPYDS